MSLEGLPDDALLLIGAAPIIDAPDRHPTFGPYFQPLPDAIPLASAIAITAFAPVTHDRDFSAVRGFRIIR